MDPIEVKREGIRVGLIAPLSAAIVVANTLAVVCAGSYLLSRHAALRRRLLAG